MRNKKFLKRIRAADSKSKEDFDSIKNSQSILKFRIAYNSELEGTVPVNVINQAWPVFVYADVYIDGSFVSGARYIEGKHDYDHSVQIAMTLDGLSRINALASDVNITLVMFIDSYPTMNICIPEKLDKVEISATCFPKKEQARYFYGALSKEIDKCNNQS